VLGFDDESVVGRTLGTTDDGVVLVGAGVGLATFRLIHSQMPSLVPLKR